jgi:hypothetical protein
MALSDSSDPLNGYLDFNPNGPTLHAVDGGFLVFLGARDRDTLVALIDATATPDTSQQPQQSRDGSASEE